MITPTSYPAVGVPVNTCPPIVAAISEIARTKAFAGNITPRSWFAAPRLQKANGKAHLLAINLLSEIVYWHRESESGGKKFAADRYWINYGELADVFHQSEDQMREAVKFLKDAGIIEAIPEYNVRTPYGVVQCLLYVVPVVDAIREITGAVGDAPAPSPGKIGGGSAKTGRGSAKKSEHSENPPELPIFPTNVKRSGEDMEIQGQPRKAEAIPLPVPPPLPVDKPASVSRPSVSIQAPDDGTQAHATAKHVSREPGLAEPPAKPAQNVPVPAPESPCARPEPLSGIDGAARDVARLCDDKKSLRRYQQLYHRARQGRCLDLWDAAVDSVRKAMRERRAFSVSAGAYFDGTLRGLMGKRGVFVPSRREEADQGEAAAGVAEMLALLDAAKGRRFDA